MKNLFLATSFSGHVNYDTGEVFPEYRAKTEAVISNLREINGLSVFCAVEHEDWIISNEPPEVGVEKDLAEIYESDVVLALLPQGIISAGVQYEMGYADAHLKQVIAATELGADLSYFNQGVVNLGRIAHLNYDGPVNLARQVGKLLDYPS